MRYVERATKIIAGVTFSFFKTVSVSKLTNISRTNTAGAADVTSQDRRNYSGKPFRRTVVPSVSVGPRVFPSFMARVLRGTAPVSGIEFRTAPLVGERPPPTIGASNATY